MSDDIEALSPRERAQQATLDRQREQNQALHDLTERLALENRNLRLQLDAAAKARDAAAAEVRALRPVYDAAQAVRAAHESDEAAGGEFWYATALSGPVQALCDALVKAGL